MAKRASAIIEPDREFRGEVASAIAGVRRRLGTIVESVCGGHPRAQDITDRFGVYRKLGWQIWNVVYADEPMAAIRHLPNPKSMKLLEEAAVARGVPAEQLIRLGEAIAIFEKSAKLHADDRETLEMLVESNAERPDEESAVRWRKGAFAGNAFTWGVRAKCMFACAILFPSNSKAGFFDMVRIQGLLGLIRTRSNVRWPFAQLLVRDEKAPNAPLRTPLIDSASVRETGVPLMEDFCSRPLPKVQRRPGNMGMVEDELLPGEVGQAAAANLLTAEILREVAPAFAEKPGQTASFGTGVRTPCELLVSDLLMHRDLRPPAKRELCVFGELMTPLSRDERDRIPVPERVQSMGSVADGIETADVPNHADLLRVVFERAGLQPGDFSAFRVRMRYPPLPISVVMRGEMPVLQA